MQRPYYLITVAAVAAAVLLALDEGRPPAHSLDTDRATERPVTGVHGPAPTRDRGPDAPAGRVVSLIPPAFEIVDVSGSEETLDIGEPLAVEDEPLDVPSEAIEVGDLLDADDPDVAWAQEAVEQAPSDIGEPLDAEEPMAWESGETQGEPSDLDEYVDADLPWLDNDSARPPVNIGPPMDVEAFLRRP